MTIYFGGDVLPPARLSPKSYSAETNLDTLDEAGLRIAFLEWLTQCWLHDEQIPEDPQVLATFDLDALVPRFRWKFAAGDWRRMRAGRGATLEEYILYLQLANRGPVAAVLNREQPQQACPRIRHKLTLSEFQLGALLIDHLATAGREPQPMAGALPVMLYDGQVGHVITVRKIDDGRELISYDDPTWPRASSMLCAGENAAGVSASYLGRPEVGEWMVDVRQLPRLIYCIPASLASVPYLKRRAREAERQLRRPGGHQLGAVSPPERHSAQ